MKYYDIHTHKYLDAAGSDCLAIHNLSVNEITNGFVLDVPNLYYSCGIHPRYIDDTRITMSNILRLATSDYMIVAIGECGLDKLIDTPMDIQKQIFEEQIQLAENLGLPLIIHCVKAWDELLELYKKHNPQIPSILHGFRGGKEQAMQLMKFGFYFSIGKHFNKECLPLIYPENILLETDDSCINIQEVYIRVATDLSVELDGLVSVVEQNVSRIFNL